MAARSFTGSAYIPLPRWIKRKRAVVWASTLNTCASTIFLCYVFPSLFFPLVLSHRQTTFPPHLFQIKTWIFSCLNVVVCTTIPPLGTLVHWPVVSRAPMNTVPIVVDNAFMPTRLRSCCRFTLTAAMCKELNFPWIRNVDSPTSRNNCQHRL